MAQSGHSYLGEMSDRAFFIPATPKAPLPVPALPKLPLDATLPGLLRSSGVAGGGEYRWNILEVDEVGDRPP